MGKSTKRRRGGVRMLRVRSKRHGVLAAVWAIISALLTIAWLTLGGVLWFVAALLMALSSVMMAIATFDPDAVVPAAQPKKAEKPNPRGKGSARPRRSSPGTAQRKSSPTKPKRRVCSARCQASTKPVSTCNCVCQGRTHGSKKLRAVG